MPSKGNLCALLLALGLLFLAPAGHVGAEAPHPSSGSQSHRLLLPMVNQSITLEAQTTASPADITTGERLTISSKITNPSAMDVSADVVVRVYAPDRSKAYEQTWRAQAIGARQVRSIETAFVPAVGAAEGYYTIEVSITCARTYARFFHNILAGSFSVKKPSPLPANGGLYWGIAMQDIPWNLAKLENWENSVGKRMSIVHFWNFWNQGGTMQKFQAEQLSRVRAHGSIPMVSWPSEKMGGGKIQPDFRLREIINGRYDSYIRQWATDAKNWGHPFFLRYGHEMNGPLYPWSEDANGNARGDFVKAWRRIHDIFIEVGARNATWVWCPNVDFPNSPWPTVQSLYPGDTYVDWTCMDGYNWGEGSGNGWQTFEQVYSHTYNNILRAAPNKPLMVGEVGSSTNGDKPGWIRDAIGTAIPQKFAALKAFVWYNWQFDGQDWRIESSSQSLGAFKEKIALPVYLPNQFGNVTTSPIPPMR
jgi:hypothetical protein